MKVVYVGGSCDFCEGFAKYFPTSPAIGINDLLHEGRAYTVVHAFKAECWWPPFEGSGYRLAEVSLPEKYGHCSCGFREIDGDAEEWKLIMQKNRPKTKELEPA